MDNNKINEVNEFLAEKLFGLKQGVDFGELFEYKHDNPYGGRLVKLCKKCYEIHDPVCYTKAPDYIKNYQPILEKLRNTEKELCEIELCFRNKEGFCSCDICIGGHPTYSGKSKDIGEAICNAAVSYLQNQPNYGVKIKRGAE